MKKFLAFCLAVTMIFALKNPMVANAQSSNLLSEMSEEECVAFLKEKGVEIPGEFDDELAWGAFAKGIIEQVETNPNIAFPFGYSVLLGFANDIKSVVNDYYGMENSTDLIQTRAIASLRDNTVYGSWDDDYKNYNCYGYAIGYYDKIDPGSLSNNSISMETSISDIAGSVRADLQALGYTVLTVSATMPTVTVSDHTNLICVRKDVDGVYLLVNGSYYLIKDYHFMKLGQDGYWYHKPGETNPLRYHFTPTNSSVWISEGRNENGLFQYLNWTYDSEIWFIEYTTPHVWNYVSAGTNQHRRTCTICGYEVTESCDYTYTYFYDDMHNASCKYCSNGYSGAFCTFTYTSNGNGTHTASCNNCGNTKTANCYLKYTNITNTRHSVSCTVCDYYITSQSCSVTYTSRGNKTHTASCSQCKNTFTGNCSITYSYTSSNQHRGSCNKCSYSQTAACYYMTTYCGNSTLGDVHKKQCQTCGHISGSATTACTFALKSNGNNTHSNTCTQCGYVKAGPTACVYKSDNTCRFCGAMKNSAVINDLEEQETQ